MLDTFHVIIIIKILKYKAYKLKIIFMFIYGITFIGTNRRALQVLVDISVSLCLVNVEVQA